MATPVGETGSKVRFARDSGGMSATNSQKGRAAVSLELVSERSGPVHCDICTSLKYQGSVHQPGGVEAVLG
jgi:hypothetical protein